MILDGAMIPVIQFNARLKAAREDLDAAQVVLSAYEYVGRIIATNKPSESGEHQKAADLIAQHYDAALEKRNRASAALRDVEEQVARDYVAQLLWEAEVTSTNDYVHRLAGRLVDRLMKEPAEIGPPGIEQNRDN